MTDTSAAPRNSGQSVTQAVRFLQQVFKDIVALSATLTGLMEERGWVEYEWGKASLKYFEEDPVYILYGPEPVKETDRLDRAIAFEIHLAPPAPHEEPQCLVTAVTFPQRLNCSKVFRDWDAGGGSTNVLKRLHQQSAPVALSEEMLKGFLPMGHSAIAFAVPLWELRGAASLMERIIEPALAASSKLEKPTKRR